MTAAPAPLPPDAAAAGTRLLAAVGAGLVPQLVGVPVLQRHRRNAQGWSRPASGVLKCDTAWPLVHLHSAQAPARRRQTQQALCKKRAPVPERRPAPPLPSQPSCGGRHCNWRIE